MKKLLLFAAPLALAFGSVPATAQSADDETADSAAMAEIMGEFAAMFPAEPLTAEQQSRLPAATALIDQIVPTGTLGDMMGSMLDGVLGPIMAMEAGDATTVLASSLGMDGVELDITPERAAQALAIIDPDWDARQKAELAAMPAVMQRMFVVMEPTMKAAMSELYAVYFDDQELSDISAFFNTASGAAYARKSFTMSADPRMTGAMMQALPDMMGVFAEMEEQMAAATIGLANPRSFDQLSAVEKKKLAALTGLDEATIAESFDY